MVVDTKRGVAVVIGASLAAAVPAGSANAQYVDDLRHMSLEELANVNVSSVLKTSGALSEAPAAIYVISQEDITRSGATTVPEALRLAPNLQVAQTSASKYVITARGLSGNNQAQNFPNKLLVLIDGQSVYTPLFSGVYWDAQDVLLADVDRIEVISGPGATLWGANAVNGVINIITRDAAHSQGALIDVAGGSRDLVAAARYGGRLGGNATFRVYAKALRDDQTMTAAGAPAGDGWDRVQGGFRIDWTPSTANLLTLQGDAYGATIDQAALPAEVIYGRNLLARWTRSTARGAWQAQAYYDRTVRRGEAGGADFGLDTYDVDIQRSLTTGRHALVAGSGLRVSRYRITAPGGLAFSPPNRTLTLANAFVQDTIALSDTTKATLGVKLEDDPYSGLSVLPNVRLSLQPRADTLFWGAASRAVRSPTPFDTDVVETIGTTVFLVGDPDFRTEKVTAFELGARLQPARDVSFSVSAFYNAYDDLRSIEPKPVSFLPLRWGNKIAGRTYGAEAWADFKLTPWWRLTATYSLLLERFRFDADASKLLGLVQVSNDPKHQASLRSSMNIGAHVTADAMLRYVAKRPAPHVPAFAELNARIGWRASDHLQLSVAAFNLLHASHQEYVTPDSNRIPRRVLVGLQWRL